jgi:hypothetical protein
MKKQLEQMGTELREIMVYQSPPELGALYTEVEDMMEISAEHYIDVEHLLYKHIGPDNAVELETTHLFGTIGPNVSLIYD